ncbi:hypothetical protein DOS84_15920 [Flavobacterium aquariorum]|uniref:DUF3857 domain-containing protein n=1 Tax=Flavobacterium aquariorum TaxID=2217670 RepID=A0A2W7UAN9_9FLAO|nr:DUF3857 domain-containing protein [Flavobacterium aquariorum]PZX92297.1 hypothetical protein DOS84_15920 [Flavobacterium aquariorum]
MRNFKSVLGLLILFSFIKLNAQNFELGKVSVAELKEKQHSKDTSAVAAVLFKNGKTSFDYSLKNGFVAITEVTMRIKIYKKEGSDWANFTLPYYVGYENYNDDVVKFSNAATYNLENGSIVKTKLNSEGSFKKNVNEYWNEAWITLPNVKVGSVIEFKYVLKTENIVKFPVFNFQDKIPVNYAEYTTNIPYFFTYKPIQVGFIDIKMDSKVVGGSFSFDDKNSQTVNLSFRQLKTKYTAENIPALKEENFVDNIQNYQSSLHHELEKTNFPDEKEKNYSKDWDGVAKTIYADKEFGIELQEGSYLLNDLKTILKDIDSKEERLAVVFKFVQNRMNWNNDNGYYTDKGVKKAYIDKTGNVAEINFILISMLKLAGLDASPVLVSTREHGIPVFPNRTVFNYVVAAVVVDGKQVLLDATHKYTTQNILPLNVLNWKGRLIKQEGISQEIDLVPTKPSGKYYTLMVKMDKTGKMEGKYRFQMTDYDAYSFREKYAEINTDTYLEKIENDFGGIKIQDYSIDNKKTDLANPILENFTFTASNYCDIIGDKVYINPMLFFTQSHNPFVQEKRQMPIYFGYPKQEKYNISFEIPEGYIVESIPQPMKISTEGKELSFSVNTFSQGNKILILVVKENSMAIASADFYEPIKEFYQKMIDKQNEKIVLKKIQP